MPSLLKTAQFEKIVDMRITIELPAAGDNFCEFGSYNPSKNDVFNGFQDSQIKKAIRFGGRDMTYLHVFEQ